MDEERNEFMNSISQNFDKIKEQFSIQIKRLGLAFDDDVFSDTIIKCNNNLKLKKMDKREMISYFWTAFKNNTLRELKYSRNNSTNVYPENLLSDEPAYNDMFETVSKLIIDEFGEELYELFTLHANGTSYDELSAITEISNLKYRFRCIREYVRANV